MQLAGKESVSDRELENLAGSFRRMMSALYREEGASLRVELLGEKEVTDFIDTHAGILDSSLARTDMSDAMRERLRQSNWIFSGLKTFHELNEAFPSLIDEKGNKKPFERFLNDVKKIDDTYNRNYLRAEYNFAGAAAQMAGKWEEFAADEEDTYLQYRTAHDDKVRPEHAGLDGITLPLSDRFWDYYYPPNGWNCRCNVVEVLRFKNTPTPHDEAMQRAGKVFQKDRKGMFRFNPGKEQRTFPAYNPYTISKCRNCNKANDGTKLAKFVPDNELCAACKIIHKCIGDKKKSERAIERTHYLHEMEPLLKKSEVLKTKTMDIKVGFTTYGNKHLFSDTFGRSSILTKEDLSSLDKVLKTAKFVESSRITHPRSDDIDQFYYYEAEIRGFKVRLNVARKNKIRNNGKVQNYYFLYSINDL